MSIANSNVIAKVAAVVAGLGLVFSSFAYAVPAKAATTAELEAQVAALLAQIQALQGGSSVSAGAAFTMDMTIGASGAEVTRLQNWLISKGYSIPAGATGYFGAQTAAAVAKYQMAKGITPAAGYFGPMTRAAVNAEGGSSTGGNTGGNTGGSTGGDLEGGAGSIDEAELISGFSNEEVGEDEEDVEVYGLEITADDGSDIELTAVRVVFDEGTADEDFDNYASEVSIWFDGEEVARLDADEFNDDNDWSKTVSLDDGAIIRADEAGELMIAVSGISNLDSGDDTETWDVAITSVRFVDADGATVSDTNTGDIDAAATRTFSFEFFATAADAELALSLTDGDDADDINDAHVIDIDDNDDTDGVEILAFTMEVEGDSDLTVDELPVLLTATGVNIEDAVTNVSLWLDDEEIGSENTTAAAVTETVTFDDLDLVLEAGESYDFMVTVDLVSTAGAIDNGDTLKAEITSTQFNAADIEDESGEDLANGDRTGTASGEASSLRDSGIMVEFVSADAEVTTVGDAAATTPTSDIGTFTITFDVTAFDTDAYIDLSAPLAAGGTGESDLTITGAGTVVSTIDTTSGADQGTDGFLVDEDATERFEITTSITATTDGFFQVALADLVWAVSDVDGNLSYTFNLDEFKTSQLYLNDN